MKAAHKKRHPGFMMTDEHRVKIKNSNILNALVEHIEGKREMSATQVSAGLGLLRKVLPDLSAVDLTNKTPLRDVRELTKDELAAIILTDETRSGERIPAPTNGSRKPH